MAILLVTIVVVVMHHWTTLFMLTYSMCLGESHVKVQGMFPSMSITTFIVAEIANIHMLNVLSTYLILMFAEFHPPHSMWVYERHSFAYVVILLRWYCCCGYCCMLLDMWSYKWEKKVSTSGLTLSSHVSLLPLQSSL